jgi:C4-dicarboxylate-specific signal transduction histidine kinase
MSLKHPRKHSALVRHTSKITATTTTMPYQEPTTRSHSTEEQATHHTFPAHSSDQLTPSMSTARPLVEQSDMGSDSTNSRLSQQRSLVSRIPQDLFHDQNSRKFLSYQSTKDPRFQSSYPSLFLFIIDADGSDAPFRINRKLLRRRHVRKEQIQKRKEQEKAKRVERQEMESQKRRRAAEAMESTKQSSVGRSSSALPVALSTPKRSAEISRMNNSIRRHGIRVALFGSPRYDSPNFMRVPTFSPLRPTKRRNTRFA